MRLNPAEKARRKYLRRVYERKLLEDEKRRRFDRAHEEMQGYAGAPPSPVGACRVFAQILEYGCATRVALEAFYGEERLDAELSKMHSYRASLRAEMIALRMFFPAVEIAITDAAEDARALRKHVLRMCAMEHFIPKSLTHLRILTPLISEIWLPDGHLQYRAEIQSALAAAEFESIMSIRLYRQDSQREA